MHSLRSDKQGKQLTNCVKLKPQKLSLKSGEISGYAKAEIWGDPIKPFNYYLDICR